ncbi:MAG: PorP/SprF family type IX secretion system membrane protein [Crocinitomicaceae bacterium]|nr:PorP/SprF family type IX secretion system membrane protein [Flavobacteriales bacterium]NQZ37751.1 PorP/SprF family type IX secretion system membrane protein [Crocinitomicaceae bacterium]
MKGINKYIAVGVVCMIVSGAFAQQTRQTNLYNYNKFSLNPAYAGSSGCTELNFSHVNQWVKVEGAPTTSFFNANTRLGKNWGVGADILLDRLGLFQQVSVNGAVSYGVTIARDHHVRLGISAGYFQMRIDPTNVIAFDDGDQIIDGGVQTASSLNTSAGVLYQFKGLELSFASKQLIESRSNFNLTGLEGYGLKRHFVGYASYDISLNKQLSLKPNVLYRGVGNVQQFDFNADINYNDFVYGGIGWRTQVGLVARIGVNIRKLFFLGYAYEAPMQNLASYGAGSHEITLGLKFCKKEKEEIIDPIAKNITPVVPVTDTITIVERIVDTVFVDRPIATNDINQAMLNASENLEFLYDKSIIVEESYASLEGLTNILLIRKDVKIQLDGHTDGDGTEAYNLKLSKNRVEAVKRFLVANGVDASRIKTDYHGETKPISSNDNENGKARNRRVEMKIISE